MNEDIRMTGGTHFVDIDGTIFKHQGDLHGIVSTPPVLLPGVIQKFLEWRRSGDYIILTTARPEGLRSLTEQQLYSRGVFWDQLVMGLPTGPRTVWNDTSAIGPRAFAVQLKRDAGLINTENPYNYIVINNDEQIMVDGYELVSDPVTGAMYVMVRSGSEIHEFTDFEFISHTDDIEPGWYHNELWLRYE